LALWKEEGVTGWKGLGSRVHRGPASVKRKQYDFSLRNELKKGREGLSKTRERIKRKKTKEEGRLSVVTEGTQKGRGIYVRRGKEWFVMGRDII